LNEEAFLPARADAAVVQALRKICGRFRPRETNSSNP
jgi:hypothetical protein